ncbi:MAG: Gldg family protein [Verrucomicrobiota bacterium]|jgi:ABC-type uncharacterized transport system involved in gliding motility auxiliary subunit
MKEKNVEAILYSTAGVAAMFVLLIAFYVVTSSFKARVDLTAEKAYTLSAGTRHILAKLDSPVTLRYYCSQAGLPPELKPYAQEIEDLLGEYLQAGKGRILLEKYDPKPDSDAEDSARLNGVQGEPVEMGGDRIYLGLAISQLDNKVAIPSWLDLSRNPSRERLLEYEISRAISRVINPEPATIGIMSALPVMGEMPNPMLMRMGQQAQQPAVFVSELKKDFKVDEVPMTATQIDADIKVLIVDHPRDISEAAQYAIDQFIMRGGKMIAFLDPHAFFDQKHDQMAQVLGESSGQSSLPRLLKAWGLDMDINKVVADANSCVRFPQGAMPTVPLVSRKGVNEDDPVTSQIDTLEFPFPGAFTGKPADGLTETVLAQSSTNAELVESITAGMNGEQILKDFKGTGIHYVLALRLTGKFKTAFPEGKPAETPPGKDEPKPAATDTNQLKESTNTAVVLVADTDLLADNVAFSVGNLGGLRIAQPLNGNVNFLLNAVEQLAGDSDLIAVRSRGGLNRPFTRLQELEANAGKQWQDKLKELETLRNATQQKISELQASKQGAAQQQFILSPEQRAELQKYQAAESDYGKQLRQVQKNLRKDTDSLETRIRVLNIGAMPALVALTGIVLSIVKRKRTAAK